MTSKSRAALIGLGMVSSTYGNAIRASTSIALETLFAPSLSSQEKFLCSFPDLCDRTAKSVQDIADDPAVDFAIVTTPPNARREIVEILLGYLRQRLAERDMHLELTPEALDQLAEVGYDPVYGARPLKRAVQQRIENPLAEDILRGEFKPGDTVTVAVEDGAIAFR